MTEAARAKRRPGAAPVFWTSMALFCVLLGLLTYRFSIGQDPSGVGADAAAPLVRQKVIVRRVVTTVVPAGAGEAGSGAGAGAPSVSEAPAPEAVPVSEPVTSSS
ncbi:MAG TPA: hypothetical protein VLI94_00150 [Solirubrobacterales bacterium]|nr:hypothetical protein [Solirubrobacterales bacterium]